MHAPHLRSTDSIRRLLERNIIATLPCWLIGLWSVGHQSNVALSNLDLQQLPGWRGATLTALGIGFDPAAPLACFAHGLVYFLPVFISALLAITFWARLFSKVRRRPFDPGVLIVAWLFALVMPAGVPLYQVVVGISFGYVFGSAIYGGYGRYLVNPALLALTFLLFAYPDLVFGPNVWIPVPGWTTILPSRLAGSGGLEAVTAAGYSGWDLFVGNRPSTMGASSVLGCMIGAVYLVITRTASWRIMLGALAGLLGTGWLFNALAPAENLMATIPVGWHMLLGGFAFGTVFFATDAVAAATTQTGRWLFGLLIGALTIVIGISNPSYNEGVLFAVLLASLFAPVIDHAVIDINIRRRRRRAAERTA